jgi:hypothetical protein
MFARVSLLVLLGAARAAAQYSPYVADLMAHGGRDNALYVDADATSSAHELTHYVNGLLRERAGGGWGAFYCYGGLRWHLREPRVTLRDVVARIPQRGPLYGLVAGQCADPGGVYNGMPITGWNSQPLYILDELTAYTNGAIAGRAAGSPEWQHQARCAGELSYYAKVLAGVVQQGDPYYPDLGQLVAFIRWNDARLASLSY